MAGIKIAVSLCIVTIYCIIECTEGVFDFAPISIRRQQSLNKGNVPKFPVHDFINLINRHGYPAEEYKLLTSDGYILAVHRIPGSPKHPKKSGKRIVYIQHGILASSDMFVLGGPEQDLAFMLADKGYDVWLGNGRGNTYSRSHIKMSPKNPKFWEFSFHEIALTDVKSMINYVLDSTNQSSLVYVGHSMGTTMSLVLLSSKPEYNKKISLVVNMATIGNWKKPRNLMKFFEHYGEYVKAFLFNFGISEILPQTIASAEILNGTCRQGSILEEICKKVTYFIVGDDRNLMKPDLLVEGLGYFPAGGSRKTLLHFHQNILAGKLQMFDYGLMKNFVTYGQITPPRYNLNNIATRVYMFYGKGDAVAPPEDSLDLLGILKNARAEEVPYKHFNHLDYVWANDIKSLLHNRVIEVIENSFSSHRT